MILPKRITHRWLKSLSLEELKAVERELAAIRERTKTRVSHLRWFRTSLRLHMRPTEPSRLVAHNIIWVPTEPPQ
jgi:hypothetical protein